MKTEYVPVNPYGRPLDAEHLKEYIAKIRGRLDFMERHAEEIWFDTTAAMWHTMYGPYGQNADPEVQDRLKSWLRRMKEIVMADGLGPIEKFSDDTSFGFIVPKLANMRFAIPTEVSCEMVPVLNDNGDPIVEWVTRWESVEVKTMQVKTEKRCMSLNVDDVEL